MMWTLAGRMKLTAHKQSQKENRSGDIFKCKLNIWFICDSHSYCQGVWINVISLDFKMVHLNQTKAFVIHLMHLHDFFMSSYLLYCLHLLLRCALDDAVNAPRDQPIFIGGLAVCIANKVKQILNHLCLLVNLALNAIQLLLSV